MGFLKPKIPAMPPIPEVKPLPEPPKYDDAQREEDAARKRARRKMVKLGRARPFDGKDVDHKNGNPKDNKTSNLSMMGRSKNRSKH